MVAELREVTAHEVHQKEAAVQVDHPDPRHLKVRSLQKIKPEQNMQAISNMLYMQYMQYMKKYGNRCDTQSMTDVSMIFKSDM